jgi:signal peptidase I
VAGPSDDVEDVVSGGAEPGRSTTKRERSPAWWALEWLFVIALALVLAVTVRTYVIQTFFIPSGSMEPTLDQGDRILVFKLAYDFTSPAIGDVVVFKAPPTEHCGGEPVTDLVKRIVGLPGQTIWSGHAWSSRPSSIGNTIWLENPGSTHPYRLDQDWPHYRELNTPITVTKIAANHYFMMGDNHPASCDSRFWGTVPRHDIVGKVVLKIWPLSQFGTI